MENILEVKKLSKKYTGFELKNISFELPKGMIMGFIGENGAGKTTTIKAILDIIKEFSGDIKIFGLDVKKEMSKVQENIGVVLDDMFFPEILTPNDLNTVMKGIYKNWDSNLYFKYLQEFSLPKDKQIKILSKGMRKKLEIIVSLSHHPKFLILDEPTSGLDPIARNDVIKIFQDFIENGECSIFFSSHITTDLEHIADYITFINNGEIVLSKTCDELLNDYAVVKCTEKEFKMIDKNDYMKYLKTNHEYECLIENKKTFKIKYKITTIDNASLESIMLIMIKGEK